MLGLLGFLTFADWWIAYLWPLLGCFVAIYRILLNAFPLLFPANVPITLNLRNLTKKLFSSSDFDNSVIDESSRLAVESDSLIDITPITGKREARLSFVAQAHQTWLRRRSPRWHSIVAGAVAGAIAISFENPSRQKVITQQLFVRQVPLCDLSHSRNSRFSVFDIAASRVPTMPIPRSADSESRMETS